MSSRLQTHGEIYIVKPTDKIPTNTNNNKIKIKIEDKLNTITNNSCKNEYYSNNNNDNNNNSVIIDGSSEKILNLNNCQIMDLKKYKYNREILVNHKENLKKQFREDRKNLQDICVGLDEEGELIVIDGHHRVEAMQELIAEEGLIQYTMSARLLEGKWDDDRITSYKVDTGLNSRKESGKNIIKYLSSYTDAPRDIVLFNELLSMKFCRDAKIKLGIADILECNPFKKIRSAISTHKTVVKLFNNKFKFKGGNSEISSSEGERVFNTINNITEYAHALDSVECRNKNFRFSTKDGRFMLRFMIAFHSDMARFSRNYKNTKKCLETFNNYKGQLSAKNNSLNEWFKFINSIYFTKLQISKCPMENFAYRYDNDSFDKDYIRYKPVYFDDYKFNEAMRELKSHIGTKNYIVKNLQEDSLFNN